jgi:hypothetical protein
LVDEKPTKLEFIVKLACQALIWQAACWPGVRIQNGIGIPRVVTNGR